MDLKKTPIDVICMIDKAGKITPLKMRIESETDGIITAKINEVVYCKENNYAGFKTFDYGCKVVIGEVTQLIELRFCVAEHTWRIHKVLWD